MKITSYQAICNLGGNIDEIYKKAINGNINCFENINTFIKEDIRAGLIKTALDKIEDKNFDLRCNRVLLKASSLIDKEITRLKEKYSPENIAIVCATTNSGVEEYEKSQNQIHSELSNPAYFLKNHLGLKGFYATVSTACSSGLKAFILAKDLLKSNSAQAVIVACVDTLAKIPAYGFNSLEILSDNPSIPFSKNRKGMNLGEAGVIFITEKEADSGIDILGLGESSDIFHPTTPNPEAKEAIIAIKNALAEAKICASDVDYINVHGTGTIANDIMEANAIFKIFPEATPVSSTKPMTGHCLGASAGIETALCCKLIEEFDGRLYPHMYDGDYDENLPKLNLVQKNQKYKKCKIIMNNSFGFGGANVIMIMGKNEQ